jgi:hypothetical protein
MNYLDGNAAAGELMWDMTVTMSSGAACAGRS